MRRTPVTVVTLALLGLALGGLPGLPAPPAAAATAASMTAAAGTTRATPTAAWTPIPSYAVAVHDEPITYRNGCHVGRPVSTPRACTFGNPSGAHTVLLFGDSHAAHWHAAVLGSAVRHGWRMLTLTKSACPADDVHVGHGGTAPAYPECTAWRRAAFAALRTRHWGRVDVAVVSSWDFHQILSVHDVPLSPADRAPAWEAGMKRTLAALLTTVRQVVLLRDSPTLPGVSSLAAACYRRWGQAAQTACGGPARTTLNATLWAAERRAAAAFPGRVTAVDLTTPTCPRGWCGPIDGRYLRFKDSNHWTQTYMRVHFGPLVDRLLVAAMARPGAAPRVLGARMPATVRSPWSPIPSYAVAAHDEPITYRTGCHAPIVVVVPHACVFGATAAKRTVLLFGDSHAAHWHAAVLASATRHRWRMLTLTKSACPAADVLVRRYKQGATYTQCPVWRHAAFSALAAKKFGNVDVAVVSNWHFHVVLSSHGRPLVGPQRAAAWEAAMRRTMTALLRGARRVVLLRDSPDLPGDATSARACYARYRQAAQTRCGASASRALSSALWRAEARAAASFAGRVEVVDLTSATCPHGWCGPIDGRYLRMKDDNHWTQTYMRVHFAPLVDALLVPAMARATAPVVAARAAVDA
jgi:hypothetical protein